MSMPLIGALGLDKAETDRRVALLKAMDAYRRLFIKSKL